MSELNKSDYSADNIQVLEGLEAVRKRPAMYIGDIGTKGFHHLVYEVVDNSIDEALAGHCTHINVAIHPNNSISVKDNGRGIPVDIHQKEQRSALEVVMTVLHAGGKFDKDTYKVSGGLHGVGVSCVNALSSMLRAEVHRDGKMYEQEYSCGKPKYPVRQVGDSSLRGTTITFEPDLSIFTVSEYKYDTIAARLRELAYLNAGISLILTDERETNDDGTYKTELFYSEGGLKEFVSYLDSARQVILPAPIHVINLNPPIPVEVALQYNDSFVENLHSYVNNINTHEGGQHVAGFRRAITRTLKSYADKNGLTDKLKFDISGDDFREGLTAVISVKVAEPQFEGQTKTKLGNSEAMGAVDTAVGEVLNAYLEEHPKEARIIINKVILAATARHAARKAREMVQRKNVLGSNSLPGKLADCSETNPDLCEIFLVEGDSAGGCFVGTTQVALADGRNLSFIELIKEQQAGKQNYCYTIKNDGSIGIEKIINARRTKQNANLLKITLDNGEIITCTPDHKFMLRNGEYTQAQHLKSGVSLMPLYKKYSKIEQRITIEGYEMVMNPKNSKWIFTHILADECNINNGVYVPEINQHKHHIDFNKLNNNPDNIVRLSKNDHLELHQKHIAATLHTEKSKEKSRQIRQSQVYRQKMQERMKQPETAAILSENAKKQWQNVDYKNYMADKFMAFYNSNEAYREANKQLLQESQQKYWALEENRIKQSEKTKGFFENNLHRKAVLSDLAKKQWDNETLKSWRSDTTKNQWTVEFREKRKQAYDKVYFENTLSLLRSVYDETGEISNFDVLKKQNYPKKRNVLKLNNFTNRFFEGNLELVQDAVVNYNHKVVGVEFVSETQDVYDIEVPNTHNFALASGVFVHNSAKQGRSRQNQAILPLRGKILNVEKAMEHRVFDNEEIKNIYTALGVTVGTDEDNRALNLAKLRYKKIVVMCDADVDGSHITTLILTFFYRYMKPLIDNGYIYIATPPLYLVKKGANQTYAWSETQRREAIVALAKGGNESSVNIQRYKGLGEMNPEQLWETTMDPNTRILRRVTIENAAEADHTFSMLMGDEVPPRREFIEKNAKYANIDA